MKPFRLDIRVKNNRLVRLREDTGLTIMAFARACGVNASLLCGYENLKESPLSTGKRAGGWTGTALKIAAFHGVSPEFIWPDELAMVRRNRMHLEVSATDVAELRSPDPHRILEALEVRKALSEGSKALSPFEVDVLIRRTDKDLTLDQVAKTFDLSRERIRQIESRALRKLREHTAVREAVGLSPHDLAQTEAIEAAIAKAHEGEDAA